MNIVAGLSALAVGAAFGFVLQRGRFCLNTALRNLFYIRDFTILRSYLLSVTVALLGAGALEQAGLVRLDPVRQDVAWLANMIGGYLFGAGMVLAGGCGGSTWYKTGEGLLGSWMAAFGFMAGASAAEGGVLSGVSRMLRGFARSGTPPGIHDLFGVNRWIVIAAVSAVAISALFARRKQYAPAASGYGWTATGVMTGLIAVAGLFVSAMQTGTSGGLTFPGPSAGLLGSLTSNRPWGWGAFMVMGVPLGAFASAKNLNEFSWRAPRADTMIQQLAGGVLMGAGGVIAGGCAIGHGITGLAALSTASMVSMTFIVLGSWTMVYFLFMKAPSGR
jgi:uncharacterized membrane protein YedE/YeeE